MLVVHATEVEQFADFVCRCFVLELSVTRWIQMLLRVCRMADHGMINKEA